MEGESHPSQHISALDQRLQQFQQTQRQQGEVLGEMQRAQQQQGKVLGEMQRAQQEQGKVLGEMQRAQQEHGRELRLLRQLIDTRLPAGNGAGAPCHDTN